MIIITLIINNNKGNKNNNNKNDVSMWSMIFPRLERANLIQTRGDYDLEIKQYDKAIIIALSPT